MGARQGILNEIVALKPKNKWARRSTEVVQSIFKVVSGRVHTRNLDIHFGSGRVSVGSADSEG